ncbi:hypothetical protein NR800_21615 [Corallococcus interemptor]|uniref:hypothetical protein n=1 Tax=Corallococcus interemptor TaxID=2316720 RepID=UPI0035D52A5F
MPARSKTKSWPAAQALLAPSARLINEGVRASPATSPASTRARAGQRHVGRATWAITGTARGRAATSALCRNAVPATSSTSAQSGRRYLSAATAPSSTAADITSFQRVTASAQTVGTSRKAPRTNRPLRPVRPSGERTSSAMLPASRRSWPRRTSDGEPTHLPLRPSSHEPRGGWTSLKVPRSPCSYWSSVSTDISPGWKAANSTPTQSTTPAAGGPASRQGT